MDCPYPSHMCAPLLTSLASPQSTPRFASPQHSLRLATTLALPQHSPCLNTRLASTLALPQHSPRFNTPSLPSPWLIPYPTLRCVSLPCLALPCLTILRHSCHIHSAPTIPASRCDELEVCKVNRPEMAAVADALRGMRATLVSGNVAPSPAREELLESLQVWYYMVWFGMVWCAMVRYVPALSHRAPSCRNQSSSTTGLRSCDWDPQSPIPS
jgi:hypothetical protein